MAVVMLSENCACQYMDKIRYADPNQFCGCIVSEDADIPFLSRGNWFKRAAQNIGGAVQQAAGAVGGAVQQAAGAVGGAVQQATGFVQGQVQQAAGAVGGAVQQAAGAVGGAVQQTVQVLTPVVQQTAGAIKTGVTGAVKTAGDPNFCPACHRVVDNIGDTIGNLTGALPNVGAGVGNIVNATFNAAGEILTGVGKGVGTFVGNAENIPCITNAVGGAVAGLPVGLNGCPPMGFNEQNRTILMDTSKPGINPLILAGAAGVALLLFMNKK